jgi:putative tricarboxylic transport membrane protein
MAFVLAPLIENSMRQSLLLSNGDLSIFVTRPISGTLFGIFALTLGGQILGSYRSKRKLKVQAQQESVNN